MNTIRRRFDEGSVPRRAGVNSVGMGGTNAFLVLEEAPRTGARERSRRPLSLLNLSARTDEALAAQVANVRETLAVEEDIELRDVCGTANRGRHHFSCRFSALGSDKDDMLAACDRFLKGERSQTGRKAKGAREPLVFLFSGQGAQYARMGEGLYRAEPAFQESLDRCLALFDAAESGLPTRFSTTMNDSCTGPCMPSLRCSRSRSRSRNSGAAGIVPQVVIGHSIGEFAAAVAAGACSLEDAAGMVAARARLMEELPEGGAMVSIGADLETVHAAWPGHRVDLAIAAENGPDRIVAAGSSAGLAVLLDVSTSARHRDDRDQNVERVPLPAHGSDS